LAKSGKTLIHASKESEDGRRQFRSRQATMRVDGANIVEIDLLRAGTCVLSFPTEVIPVQPSEPYLPPNGKISFCENRDYDKF
jgi:hypothetical protein